MTQIQTAEVQEPYFSPRLKKFRCVNGVVQIEKSKEIYLKYRSLAGIAEEIAQLAATFEDGHIHQTAPYADESGYVADSEVFVIGWTTEMSKAESEVAASLSWDS